jgi:hypothetical protein
VNKATRGNFPGWFILPVEGLSMKQINTFVLYQLGQNLNGLRQLPTDPAELQPGSNALFNSYIWLDWFIRSKPVPLEITEDSAKALLTRINGVLTKLTSQQQPKEEVASWELTALQTALTQFETILSAEVQKHLIYIVSQVSGFSMPLLVTKAEVNLPEDALEVIPDTAKKDYREAGRALAFELPTAVGFHAMRAAESTLRHYYGILLTKDGSKCDWATCVNELRKAGANKKVMQVLDQIRDLHRNPLMHPQDFLTMKEAIGLFDIAKSAISAMAEEIALLLAKQKEEKEKKEREQGFAAAAAAAALGGGQA